MKAQAIIKCARGQQRDNGSCDDGDDNDDVGGRRWMREDEDLSSFKCSFVRSSVRAPLWILIPAPLWTSIPTMSTVELCRPLLTTRSTV